MPLFFFTPCSISMRLQKARLTYSTSRRSGFHQRRWKGAASHLWEVTCARREREDRVTFLFGRARQKTREWKKEKQGGRKWVVLLGLTVCRFWAEPRDIMRCDGRVSVVIVNASCAGLILFCVFFFFSNVQPFCLGPPRFNGALPTQAHRIQPLAAQPTLERKLTRLSSAKWDLRREKEEKKKQAHASKWRSRTRSVRPGSRRELSDGQSVCSILAEVKITALTRSECRDQKKKTSFASRPVDPAEPLVGTAQHLTSRLKWQKFPLECWVMAASRCFSWAASLRLTKSLLSL